MFEPGKQYRLVIPADWIKHDPHSATWHNQIVTYYETGTSWEELRDWPTYGNDDPAPFNAWVKAPGLTTSYPGNVFAAKPEWLHELDSKPTCNCSAQDLWRTGHRCGRKAPIDER